MTETAKTPASFTDQMRVRTRGIMKPLARALLRAGFTANGITLIGLAGNAIGGALLAFGYIQWGGLLLLLSVPLDAVDGTMARVSGTVSPSGAFLDWVTDRWSEIFLFGGLIIWGVQTQATWPVLLSFAALSGSLMVSYTKARAEGLGLACNVGLMTRMERYLVMLPALLLNLPWIGAGIIAVLAPVTALQRMVYVLRPSRETDRAAATGSRTS
jgi:CDP-diacylglycerol---glycerol-3-phosphate 3-phosphatidyltransferase